METKDCPEAAEGEKLWREMFEWQAVLSLFDIATAEIDPRSCQDVLAEMVHTRDGSRVVREFIARGTAKVTIYFH
jgi:hypothetical protein